nr:retrovirus-related Pol polyprotein from transposon TNT 1-94 [Tanacetum cinerariifolium]
METLIVESPIPTVSSPVLTACVNDSSKPSSEARLFSKRVANQEETPSLDNILSLTNRFDDILGVSTSSDEIIGVKADTLVDCPKGVRPIGTKWVLKNKKDERGIVVRNKVRLVAQGHTQEEGIDYDEVFTPVARIEAIRLFLAYASFMVFIVYQMDVKSAFHYGTIDEETCGLEKLHHSHYLMDAGTNSTNFSGTKDAANQEVKKDVSSLRYVALPNWAHDALLESSSMESPIPTVSSPVPTACLNDSPEPSSEARLISKRVANQEETPSLDNILSLTN